jgi:hypothetical protein
MYDYVWMDGCMYLSMYVRMYVCTYVCMYVWMDGYEPRNAWTVGRILFIFGVVVFSHLKYVSSEPEYSWLQK